METEDQLTDTLRENKIFSISEDGKKVHPWRLCPIGKHYVRAHLEHIPPSKAHPNGETILRHAHCANNPSHNKTQPSRDILLFDELQAIDKAHFSDLIGPPKARVLEFLRADEFDEKIRGWVRYWNKVFDAKDPLDPNLVKALIASESSFRPELSTPTNREKLGFARGLMQLTDDTLSRIAGRKVELRDHFVSLTLAQSMDPSANICAGIRWLFMKRAGAKERFIKSKLDRIVTWDYAVAEYKGVLKSIIENKNPDINQEMPKFHTLYKKLLES